MSKDINDTPMQKLQFWKPKPGVQYVTADPSFIDPELTIEDKEKPVLKIPNDRQLVSIGNSLLALPKDMTKVLSDIDNIENPPKPGLFSFWKKYVKRKRK